MSAHRASAPFFPDVKGDAVSASPRQLTPDPKFLTVAEVAEMMRVSKMTVYRMVHSGELPAARLGRSFRVPLHAVEEYIRGSFNATA